MLKHRESIGGSWHDSNETNSDPVEDALDEADYIAETTTTRMQHEEVFGEIQENLNAKL